MKRRTSCLKRALTPTANATSRVTVGAFILFGGTALLMGLLYLVGLAVMPVLAHWGVDVAPADPQLREDIELLWGFLTIMVLAVGVGVGALFYWIGDDTLRFVRKRTRFLRAAA